MRLHQVLTGSCNHSDQCLSCGSIRNSFFIAYASGCDLVILDSEFVRIQVIPGVTTGNVQITCVDCCQETGKIAVSYGSKMCIFDPEPVDDQDSTESGRSGRCPTSGRSTLSARLGFRWCRSVVLGGRCPVLDLAWSPMGEGLLTCGEWIQLWRSTRPEFGLPGEEEGAGGSISWTAVWEHKHEANGAPASRISFSSDGQLFATMAAGDTRVFVWYRDRFARAFCRGGDADLIKYDSLTLNHPASVTGFYWRKTSRYMPEASVANVLLTSCKDQVCRIWCESRLSDQRGLNPTQGDPSLAFDSSQWSSAGSTSAMKNSFLRQINKLRHMSALSTDDFDEAAPPATSSSATSSGLAASLLPSHGSLYPHFTLAATISARNDIPLPPAVTARGPRGKQTDFSLHWLNNKEMHFTAETERMVDEMARQVVSSGLRTGGEDKSAGCGVSPVLREQLALLDRKLDLMLSEWKRSPDVLFTVHPVDGSLLVWLIHWLDESSVGGAESVCRLRSVQVSVHSRLPGAVPIGDAMSMSANLLVYPGGPRACAATMLSGLIASSENRNVEPVQPVSMNSNSSEAPPAPADNANDQQETWADTWTESVPNTHRSVMLVSKHENGSLNQWQLAVGEGSQFESVLSVSHMGRISGHRFHTNSAVCHPVLPLLLSTSHHNVAQGDNGRDDGKPTASDSLPSEPHSCLEDSELIMWRVDTVGPLSKAGGITELARINSPKQTAFSSVAWFPTLLPSSLLGIQSKSPAALFVSTEDGHALRLYLAVIDARNILGDRPGGVPLLGNRGGVSMDSDSSMGSPEYRVVSLQSTARPGCIVELDMLDEELSDESSQTQLLHVFPEAMVTSRRSHPLRRSGSSASLEEEEGEQPFHLERQMAEQQYAEDFYVVRLRKKTTGCLLEMWRVEIRARPAQGEGYTQEVPQQDWTTYDSEDEDVVHETTVNRGLPGRSVSVSHPPESTQQLTISDLGIVILRKKVCEQLLCLPVGVEVVNGTVAAGHLSSASIYPACFAPYLLVTACSDATVRFWKCSSDKKDPEMVASSVAPGDNHPKGFDWSEWRMLLTNQLSSSISLPANARPIKVSCAYSGRVAIAYRVADNMEPKVTEVRIPLLEGRRPGADGSVDLRVAIYECESTGGSEWVLEDTIELNRVKIPSLVLNKMDADHLLSIGHHRHASQSRSHSLTGGGSIEEVPGSGSSGAGEARNVFTMRALGDPKDPFTSSTGVTSKPFKCIHLPTPESLLLKPKLIIQLDWVSTEDGSHLLSVAVGTQILVYAAVCRDIVMTTTKTRQTLMTSSMEEIRWMKLRMIELETADDLPPFPMHTSWVREGLMVVGLDNELHVYSQWKEPGELAPRRMPGATGTAGLDSLNASFKDITSAMAPPLDTDRRSLMDQTLALPSASMSMARLTKTYSSYRLAYSPSMNLPSGAAPKMLRPPGVQVNEPSESLSLNFIKDIGLFEAVQVCNPVLPQYHPRQLIEWMNFGKLRRVKAILTHLMRCVTGRSVPDKAMAIFECGSPQSGYRGKDESDVRFRGRVTSSLTSGGAGPSGGGGGSAGGEEMEIRAIPPLPLYALLAVDRIESMAGAAGEQPENLHDLDLVGPEPSDPSWAMGSVGSSGGGSMRLSGTLEDDEEDMDEVEWTMQEEAGGIDVPGRRRSAKGRRRRRTASSSGGQGGAMGGLAGLLNFGPQDANQLSERLMRLQLPGLTALDQMYLLGIAELMANMRTDMTERLSGLVSPQAGVDAVEGKTEAEGVLAVRGPGVVGASTRRGLVRMNTMGEGTGGYVRPEGSLMGTTDSLDDCGLRFLLTMQLYSYMMRTLSMKQRNLLQNRGLSSSSLVWAFHTEAEQELLERVPGMAKDELTWREFRQYGCGWWIRNNNTLRRCIEKIARNAFQTTKDPMDAAIFYLAMKKVKIMAALFRNSTQKSLESFFREDFSQPGPCRKAKINAFNLLSKRRYMHAAALFLVSGSLSDAVQVCLDKLKDLQLAMVIARLYEGDMLSGVERVSPALQGILRDLVVTHSDPFYRSMGYWTLGEYQRALDTLLDPPVTNPNQPGRTTPVTVTGATGQADEGAIYADEDSYTNARPSAFNFYIYLRSHPLLVRQRLLGAGKELTSVETSDAGTDISSKERRLFFRTAHVYFQIGCPVLALEVLSKLPEVMYFEEEGDKMEETVVPPPTSSAPVTLPAPAAKEEDIFGWGSLEPSGPVEDEPFKVQFSESEGEEEVDEFPAVEKQKKKDEEPPVHKKTRTGTIDIMAHQLKFIACLKIISEELSTLATGIEPDGGHLRYHFYIWLEREVEVLQQLCNYNLDFAAVPSLTGWEGGLSGHTPGIGSVALSTSPTSMEILTRHSSQLKVKHRRGSVLYTEADLSATTAEDEWVGKIRRLEKRKRWLQCHETLLRSLASFCSLQGASGVGLASVRMELLLLLQELQQNLSTKLHTPLPLPTNLPLVAAALAPAKTVVANPIQHLNCQIRDITDSLNWIPCPYAASGVGDPAAPCCPLSQGISTLLPDQEQEVLVLRNLSTALSSCLYQSLSDSDSVLLQQSASGIEGFTRHYSGSNVVYAEAYDMRLRRKSHAIESMKGAQSEQGKPTSEPSKWPGTVNMLSLLKRRADADTPNLVNLLCEALAAVYLGVLYFGLHMADAGLLYRIARARLDRSLWWRVFGGGGLRKRSTARPERPPPPSPMRAQSGAETVPTRPGLRPKAGPTVIGSRRKSPSPTPSAVKDRAMSSMQAAAKGPPSDSMASQRMRLISQVVPPQRPERPNVEERFISPQISVLTCLLEKPEIDPRSPDFVYDSDDPDVPQGYEDYATAASRSARGGSEEEEDEDLLEDAGERAETKAADEEWSNPKSYSWCLIRYAMVRRALEQIDALIHMLEIESGELAISCPYLFRCIKRLHSCEHFYRITLDWMGGPPDNYFPANDTGLSTGQGSARAILRFRTLLDPGKTPFKTLNPFSLPLKRLWCFLVKQECLQELFMRYVYKKPKSQMVEDGAMRQQGRSGESAPNESSGIEVLKVVHKEQEAIISLCVNQANLNCIALATSKEVIELDVSHLLHPPVWLEDDIEYDIEVIRKPSGSAGSADDFILVERPPLPSSMSQPPSAPGVLPAPREHGHSSGHSGNVMSKRSITGVQRMVAHPGLPYYLCGSNNGQLHLFEWDHTTPVVASFNSPCHKGKITALKFDDNGRKFGVGDSDGMFALWHAFFSSTVKPPFFTCRCHSKGMTDFCFLNSSSVFASAGLAGSPMGTSSGSDSGEATLAIWDTLMPPGRAAVQQYSDNVLEAGCTAVCPALRHQVLVVGTRRGEVALVDMRQAQVRHSFLAHEAAVKSLVVDPMQEFCITGSADGNIKVWRLGEHELIASFRGEHSKAQLFRQSDVGISELYLFPDNRLLSCGADGAIKLRQLDPKVLFRPPGQAAPKK